MGIQEIIGQAIGIVAMIVMSLSFQCRKSAHVFLVQLIACLLFSTHFLLLGAYTGLILNGLEVIRYYLLYREDKAWTSSKPVIIGVMVMMALAGVVTWEGWYSFFPVFATVASTPLLWSRDAKKLRYAGLFVISPCWIVYNVVVFSISGIINESLNIGSILISLIRYKGFREEQPR